MMLDVVVIDEMLSLDADSVLLLDVVGEIVKCCCWLMLTKCCC